MDSSTSEQRQNHPLYATDREKVDSLLAKTSPAEADLVDLARLLIRYEGFPGALDLIEDMNKILKLWDLTKSDLNQKTRLIWEKGYRPGNQSEESVGSGFDTSDRDEK